MTDRDRAIQRMKNLINVYVRYFLFWLMYFGVSKLIFLLYNFNLTRELSLAEITGIFYHGLKMDISMVSYLMLLPGIILSFSFLISPKILSVIFKTYTYLLLLLITLINILDIGLYPHWGVRVGISVIDYVGDPQGFFSSINWKDTMAALTVLLFYGILFIWLYKLFLKKGITKAAKQKWFVFPVMIFISALLFIPIRGGLGTSPINLSTVSFSTKFYVNQSTYNYLWNFFDSAQRQKNSLNPCNYMDIDEAYEKFGLIEDRRIYSDSILINVDKNKKPNVILILLESFSNKVISSFGAAKSYCPNIDALSKEAIIFPSFYASGNRSDRGMAAILGSYPSLLTHSIINEPEKSIKLTMISDYFNRNGYLTSFYYGGDIDFYNLKSFVLQGEYNHIIGQADFPKEVRNMSSWGAPDGYLFERVLKEMNKPEPFFSIVYTLSSHTPYDVPIQMFPANTNEEKYLNSVAYTDSCLGNFIREFKKTKYWDNTLVVITADHGHLYPGPTDIIEPATYRIPMLWTGGVVKEPAVINNIWGQPDLAPTIVQQLGWNPDSTLFGHPLMSTPSYAFYMSDTGWGYVSDEGVYFYDLSIEEFRSYSVNKNTEPNFDFAKSYMQVLHDDFLKK